MGLTATPSTTGKLIITFFVPFNYNGTEGGNPYTTHVCSITVSPVPTYTFTVTLVVTDEASQYSDVHAGTMTFTGLTANSPTSVVFTIQSFNTANFDEIVAGTALLTAQPVL
jgi:hypothetical protein